MPDEPSRFPVTVANLEVSPVTAVPRHFEIFRITVAGAPGPSVPVLLLVPVLLVLVLHETPLVEAFPDTVERMLPQHPEALDEASP